MKFKELLVVIPHSGIIVPGEITLDSISDDFSGLTRNVDWYTNWLYDFRDILGNSQLIFPYCNLILESNRHPNTIDESVPLQDIFNVPVYRKGLEPDEKLRMKLSRKYLRTFHQRIQSQIEKGIMFMLDAHSTLTARGMTDNQVELMNFQVNSEEKGLTYFCPDILIEIYANALIKLLPGIKVTVNQSRYDKVYGHICAEHSTNTITRVRNRVPSILQETNQKLYVNADRTPDYKALETLRRAFAEALYQVRKKVLASR
jgi:N-formylglutamate amidohydrolase